MIRPGVRRLFHLGLRRREEVERDTDEEIDSHLAERAARLELQGLSPEEARAEALRRFGPLPESRHRLARAARRRERSLGLRDHIDVLSQDLRYGWRMVRREPGIAAVVVALIALGVGANAATFGVLDRLLLRGPDHVRDPHGVLRIYATATWPGVGTLTDDAFDYVTYTTLRDSAPSLAAVAAYSEGRATFGDGETAEQAPVVDATWDLFPLLGVRPALGRFFSREEDRLASPTRVVVLGDALWHRRFGADPAVLGRVVDIDRVPHAVVGVAPAGFTGCGLTRVDAWRPLSLRGVIADGQAPMQTQWLTVVGRLAPGMTSEHAGADATRAFRALFAGIDDPLARAQVSVRPLWFDQGGKELTEVTVARWLLGVSLVVLLVACANAGNVLLARAVRRRREVAVRLALGITEARMVQLMLIESLLLAVFGCAAALAMAPLASRLLRVTLLPEVDWPRATVDSRVLVVSLLLTLAMGLLTGLAPVLMSRRADLVEALRSGVRERAEAGPLGCAAH